MPYKPLLDDKGVIQIEDNLLAKFKDMLSSPTDFYCGIPSKQDILNNTFAILDDIESLKQLGLKHI